MTERTEKDVLREAAEYVSEHGWTQDLYENDEGGVCALGALHAVQNALHGSAYDPLTRTITDNDLATAVPRSVI